MGIAPWSLYSWYLAFSGCYVLAWSSPCGSVGFLISLLLLLWSGFSGPRAVATAFHGFGCDPCWGRPMQLVALLEGVGPLGIEECTTALVLLWCVAGGPGFLCLEPGVRCQGTFSS